MEEGKPDNYQKNIDNLPKPLVEENPLGDAKIETYTVANGRDGPQMGIIIGRLNKTNSRFIAITKNDSDLDKLMNEECLNRDCSVKQFDDGYSIVSIN